MNSGEEIMNSGQENPRLKYLLEGAVPEIPAAGKWSRVEVRVRRLRRRRRFLRTGSALLALAVLVPAGLWVRTEIADPGQSVLITDPRGFEMGVPADVPRTPATTASPTLAPEPSAAHETPPGPDAGVEEVLAWAEGARGRWTSIHVTGRAGAPLSMEPFVLDVSPETALPGFSPDVEKRMAEYSKSNPTLMRPGEEPVIDSPFDYVINPSYWVRKELGLTAQEVVLVGMASVSGRAAFHLQATFPPDLAKEASWDVFVDRDTGIITRFRINPLPGEQDYEQIVETVTVGTAATTASPQTTVTAFGQAQTTGSTLATGVTSTVTTLLQRELKWGETATAVGGTVTVGAPVADPAAQAEQPGFNMVSCVVTLTNTGEAPITYSAFDFSLEGRSSGGTGRDTQFGSGGLGRGTLAPGSTVTGTVSFPLYEDDAPVLVWLLNPWSKGERLSWR